MSDFSTVSCIQNVSIFVGGYASCTLKRIVVLDSFEERNEKW